MAAKFIDALFAPVQMVVLLGGRTFHALSYFRITCGQCLALIERLSAHLPGMVDAHQTGDVIAFWVAQLAFGKGSTGVAAFGDLGSAKQGPERLVNVEQ